MEDFSEQPDLLTPHHNQLVSLPNANASLVLGILSIVLAFCFGIVGIICGIIGLVLANRDQELYRSEPQQYFPGSYSNSNAGKICSIIGIAIGSVLLLGYVMNYLDW